MNHNRSAALERSVKITGGLKARKTKLIIISLKFHFLYQNPIFVDIIAYVRSRRNENSSDNHAYGIYQSVKLFLQPIIAQNTHNDEELELYNIVFFCTLCRICHLGRLPVIILNVLFHTGRLQKCSQCRICFKQYFINNVVQQ